MTSRFLVPVEIVSKDKDMVAEPLVTQPEAPPQTSRTTSDVSLVLDGLVISFSVFATLASETTLRNGDWSMPG